MPHPVESHSEALARAIVLGQLPGNDNAYREPLAQIEAIAANQGWGELANLCRAAVRALDGCGGGAPTPGALDELERVVLMAADLAEGRTQAAPASGGDGELIALFLGSAQESLSAIEHLLLHLEERPGDGEAWGDLRRRLHTLKGESGVLSLGGAQALLHEAESLVDRVSAGSVGDAIGKLLPVVDWLRGLLKHLESGAGGEPVGALALAATLWQPDEATAPAGVHTRPSAIAPSMRVPPETTAAFEEGTQGELIQFPAELLADETLPDFITEARQHLESSEAALLHLEADPADPEPLNVVFRAFHTIKGVAGFLNLKPVVDLAHSTETLLDEARKGRQLLSPRHIELILASNDWMGRLLAALGGQGAPLQEQLSAHVVKLEGAIRGELNNDLDARPRLEKLLVAIGCQSAEELHAAAEQPAATVGRIGQLLVESTSLTDQQLREALKTQERLASEGRKVRIGELLVELGLVSQQEVDSAIKRSSGSAPLAKLLEAKVERPLVDLDPAKKPRVESTVVVATTRLDVLVDMVGELVIAQQMLAQDVGSSVARNDRLSRNLSQVVKITRDLQEASMSLRMVTFKSTFQKMTRLVRDVAAKSGKDVSFHTSGAETEVDRTVVERISDPLIHILRNAVDHGIEPAEQRLAAGKSAKGSLHLRAYTKSGSILIEVEDDGRGIDRAKILAKALAVGLVHESQRPEEWPDGDVFKLIFAPGFSTAEKVTDISGRGVGMDVVRRNIEGMRGKVEIESKLGRGSRFILKLPLTLAIIDGMVVRAGSERYVIPTASIVQSFRPDPSLRHRVLDEGELIDVRGELLPVVCLEAALSRESRRTVGDGVMILIESADGRVCLAVDQLLGQQQVVIKSLGKAVPRLESIAGGAILSDGQVALILDIERMIQRLLALPSA